MSVTEHYSIKEVEYLTGISAYSLRAWEKRYRALLPHRTVTNIRYYDGTQLRRLLNIATLLPLGHKASRLIALPEEELQSLVLKATEAQIDAPMQAHINNMVAAMLSFDENTFDKIISSMIIKFGLYEAMLQLIYPFLRKTGVLWTTSNTTPAQEHFASNLLQRKIQSALDALPCASDLSKRFLLFLPPGEMHEIGLLLSDYIIRSKGLSTIYLGRDLPYDSLDFAAQHGRATHMLTFLTSVTDALQHAEHLGKIAHKQHCQLLICSTLNSNTTPVSDHIHWLKEPGDLFTFL
ncbi:MerR HTH family regulatory protein [Hydrobacter penzbergensis]|uniref:MerR HTH family regulatory protein n=1 Tax=Hydrobacter penzbergensis TaxID=1235997 RepID=A0A8X8IGF2_9BACT|nr:MerR family transcriptional regulator [Hydrobacter penzbergensis]SDX03139.1 MerR HTH family regulatory protein [Hydrobacter penzbergensis]